MVKHVVMQKFAEQSHAAQAAGMLRALVGVVPTLRSMEVGLNERSGERAFDLVLIAVFDDMEGLDAYDGHPAHQAVRDYIKPRRTQSASVDYTCV